MFAEDLLRDLRHEGFSPGSVARYVRRIWSRVLRRLPLHLELIRSISAVSLLLFAIQFAAALVLAWGFAPRMGVAYLVGSSLLLLLVSFWLLVHLGLMQTTRETIRPVRHITAPLVLTMLRIVSIPAVMLLLHERAWLLALWIFVAAALTDVADGILARSLRQETRVGSVLDPLTDIGFNASVFVALAQVGVLPWWVTGLMLVRYALLVGGTFYLYVFHGPVRIQPTVFGKLTGVLTTSLLGLLLLGLASWPEVVFRTVKDVIDLGLGLLAVATIIQVVFIGLGNKKSLDVAVEEPPPAKVVGDVRWPHR